MTSRANIFNRLEEILKVAADHDSLGFDEPTSVAQTMLDAEIAAVSQCHVTWLDDKDPDTAVDSESHSYKGPGWYCTDESEMINSGPYVRFVDAVFASGKYCGELGSGLVSADPSEPSQKTNPVPKEHMNNILAVIKGALASFWTKCPGHPSQLSAVDHALLDLEIKELEAYGIRFQPADPTVPAQNPLGYQEPGWVSPGIPGSGPHESFVKAAWEAGYYVGTQNQARSAVPKVDPVLVAKQVKLLKENPMAPVPCGCGRHSAARKEAERIIATEKLDLCQLINVDGQVYVQRVDSEYRPKGPRYLLGDEFKESTPGRPVGLPTLDARTQERLAVWEARRAASAAATATANNGIDRQLNARERHAAIMEAHRSRNLGTRVGPRRLLLKTDGHRTVGVIVAMGRDVECSKFPAPTDPMLARNQGPPLFRIGDRVLITSYAGTDIQIAGEDYVVAKIDDVLVVLDPITEAATEAATEASRRVLAPEPFIGNDGGESIDDDDNTYSGPPAPVKPEMILPRTPSI